MGIEARPTMVKPNIDEIMLTEEEKSWNFQLEYINKDNALNELNNHFNSLLALQEAYPDLKASEQFLNLQETLEKIESQLQAARRIYNSEVTEFNTKRYKFPSNIVAGVCGFNEKALFEIQDYERENVNINM